jgi:hypothetical protein
MGSEEFGGFAKQAAYTEAAKVTHQHPIIAQL